MNREVQSMPVNLLLADRQCLVVGAGKVAWRKAGGLLDAGARVRLVSPDCGEDFKELLELGAVELVNREFCSGDVDGMALVFAATNDRSVNQRVLAACRERGILCCCVDGNWREGDFTTPAVTRHDDVSVAISTGGRSCRRAKLVKNALARHIESIDSADLIVVGTDHHHLTLAEREPFHLDAARMQKIGFMLMQIWGVHEFMILDTCNRIEIIAIVSREAGTNGILRHVLGFDHLAPELFYLKRGEDAWAHTALVCAGMGSQTPGEKHIAGQIKSALAEAVDRGWADGMLKDWISAALHTSKHIKNEVVPAMPNCEIEDLAIRYLEDNLPDLESKTLMIIGSGQIGAAIYEGLRSKVARIVWCYHSKRPITAPDCRAEVCQLSDIGAPLGRVDAIITAIEGDGYALGRREADQLDPARGVCAIDLGVPRNTDPELEHHPNIRRLANMDDLKKWHRRELVNLGEYIVACRRIIADHHDQFERLINSFQGANQGTEPIMQ